MKSLTKYLSALLIGIISFGSLYAFEGEVELTYSMYNNSAVDMTCIWKIKDEQVAFDMIFAANDGVHHTTFIPTKVDNTAVLFSDQPVNDGNYVYSVLNASTIARVYKGEVEVSKTEETQEISGFDCQKIIVKYDGRTTETWIATEIDIALYEYNNFFKDMMEVQGLAQLQMKGFPLSSVTMDAAGNVMTSYTPNSINEKEIEDAAYEIPSGYINTADLH